MSKGNHTIMKLIDSKTKQPLIKGQKVTTFRDETFILSGWKEPHKPSSTGFVYVKPVHESDASEVVSEQQFYPSVIGAEFYPRTDREG